MATFNKFESFVGALGLKLHELNADTLKVYLTNNAPSASLDNVKADLAGITEQNGYAAADAQNTYSEAVGVGTLACVDYEWTATGAVGPFRYVVLYNDTAANDELIAWWDYGSSISLADGEKFKVDFGASVLTIT